MVANKFILSCHLALKMLQQSLFELCMVSRLSGWTYVLITTSHQVRVALGREGIKVGELSGPRVSLVRVLQPSQVLVGISRFSTNATKNRIHRNCTKEKASQLTPNTHALQQIYKIYFHVDLLIFANSHHAKHSYKREYLFLMERQIKAQIINTWSGQALSSGCRAIVISIFDLQNNQMILKIPIRKIISISRLINSFATPGQLICIVLSFENLKIYDCDNKQKKDPSDL